MGKRKIIYMLFGLLLFLLPLSVRASSGKNLPQIEMEVSCGFQNNIKTPSCVPLRVNLSCQDSDMSGILRVEIPIDSMGNLNSSIWMSEMDGMNNKEQSYIWEREIYLERGSKLDEIFYVELPSSEVYVNVSVLSAGEVLTQKVVSCDYAEKNSLFVGVITNTGNEPSNLNGIANRFNLSYEMEVFVKFFYLFPEDICEHSAALEQLDILIAEESISLSEEQENVLEMWREKDGIFYLLRDTEDISKALENMRDGEYKDQFQAILDNMENDVEEEHDFDTIPVRKKIPLIRYIAIILLYLAAIGPGLYVFMKRKKDPKWLIGSVCALSMGFMLLIYWVGRSSSMDSPTICYEAVYEQKGEYLSKNIDFSLMVYQMKDFELELDSDYYILPKSVGKKGTRSVDVNRAETITFREKDDNSSILLQNMSAYSQNSFSMDTSFHLEEENRIHFEVSGDAEKVQIEWENPTEYLIEKAVLVLKNRAVPIGNIKADSSGNLSDAKIYSYGVNAAVNLLSDLMDFSMYNFPEYEIENLAKQIEEETDKMGKDEAFVIGIIGNEENLFADNVGFDVYGSSLIKINVDIDWRENETYWYPNLEAFCEDYKDGYDAKTNTVTGKEMVVNYQIETNLKALTFFSADYYDLKNYIPFQGKIYLFNWREGMFTELTDWDKPANPAFFEPFVSSMGVIRVYYVVADWVMGSNRTCVLPCVMASGEVE